MKWNFFLRIIFGILTFALLLLFLTKVVFEPWIGRKIQTAINERNSDYILEIGKVHLSIWSSGFELENITIRTNPDRKGIGQLKGEVGSIRFEDIQLWKAIFKKDIVIRQVTIFNTSIKGQIPFPEKERPPKVSTLNIRIDSVFFDNTNAQIGNTLTAQTFSIKDGVWKVYDLRVAKLDTLSAKIVHNFDLDALEFQTVSEDSMYSISAIGVNYSATSSILAVENFSIHPNYDDIDFTSRHKFQSDRIEAGFMNISFHNFSASEYFISNRIASSYVEIGKIDLSAYRDLRKPFRHKRNSTFQERIYNCGADIMIDSIGILNGNITYTEHAEKANEPGHISFNELKAKIYNLTNDTIFRTEEAFFRLNAEALLMGKGKLNTLLKAKIFDNQNTFSLDGTLSEMEVKELNPILEKNAFIYATSGKIDQMNFSFTANNTKAYGRLKLLYHNLDIAVKNKRTDDTTAIKERVISVIANMKVLDSNPVAGDKVRIGVIDYQRDSEKFLFNYCAKSIEAGIKSSLFRQSKR